MSNIALTHSRPRLGLATTVGHVRRLIGALGLALHVRRERRMLATLDDRSLKDVGFNPSDASVEAQRSFWDLPVDRLRL